MEFVAGLDAALFEGAVVSSFGDFIIVCASHYDHCARGV